MEGNAGAGRLIHMHQESVRIGLGQLRSNACAYFERVVSGQTIEIVRRGVLSARIMPIADGPKVAPILRSADAGTCNLDDLRARAGRVFDRVSAGETICVLWNGLLVAQILPADISTRETSTSGPSVDEGICNVDDFRRRAGEYLDRVAAGETIQVTRRGALVARISSAGMDSRESA